MKPRAAPGLRLGPALAMVVGAGCSATRATPAATVPPAPTVVRVAATEYRFDHQATVPSGRVVVRARNTGRLGHDVILVRLPDDLVIPLAEQVLSATRRPVETVAQLALAPGDRGTFAVDLAPGRYGFVCFVPDPDGETHARKGMASDLRVVSGNGAVPSGSGGDDRSQ